MKTGILAVGLFLLFVLVLPVGHSWCEQPEISLPSSAIPDSNEAVIIFMRPSSYCSAANSAVMEVTEEENIIVGHLRSKTMIPYRVKPGEHLFMVIGGVADFMKANVDAGKIYYVLLRPRYTVWKSRFSLRPITRDELGGAEFREWLTICEFVDTSERSQKWAKRHAKANELKKAEYLKKWNEKEEKPILNSDDGVPINKVHKIAPPSSPGLAPAPPAAP